MMKPALLIALFWAAPAAAWGEVPREPEFMRDVLPVLTKAGCNSGACHGSFQGRGGLRLSLLGFDPAADYEALAKDARGRRVFPAAPQRSLLLRKPSLDMPHGGGFRLDPTSSGYQILQTWIAQGLASPKLDLRVARLEISPAELVLKPGQSAALRERRTGPTARRPMPLPGRSSNSPKRRSPQPHPRDW